MYATPIIYPISQVSKANQIYLYLNPITSIVEAFKYSLLGVGSFSYFGLLYSFFFMFFLIIISFFIFKKMEINFIDIV